MAVSIGIVEERRTTNDPGPMTRLRAWSSADYGIALPEGHRFPIAKYPAIRDAVVTRGILPGTAIHRPERADPWALSLVHTPGYIAAMTDGTLSDAEVRRLGFPWGEQLRERSVRTVQATIEAARDALELGAGMTLAGGTHHAFPDHGEGFCVYNDVAIAIRLLQREGHIRRAVVIDLDVHQGNGTARIFGGDPDVFTFSMHGAKNFPFHKERSRRDVALDDGTGDAAYLALLDRHLDEVLDEARAELAIYLAGADPYVDDRFGRLGMSKEGLRARDHRVFAACRRRGLPVALTMSGGYAHDVADIAEIHSTTVKELLSSHG